MHISELDKMKESTPPCIFIIYYLIVLVTLVNCGPHQVPKNYINKSVKYNGNVFFNGVVSKLISFDNQVI